MIEIDGKEFRNLQEQVAKNQEDIKRLLQIMGSALPDPIAGPVGPAGPAGATGATGPRGASVFGVSSILPSAAGFQNGDFFILSNGYLYKKVADAWQLQCSIKGPQGIKGDTGNVSANPETVSEVLSTIEIDGIGYQVLDTFSQSLRDYMAVNNNKLELNFASTFNVGGTQSLLQYIQSNSTEVTASLTNGYINVDGTPIQVYNDTNIREVAEGKCKAIVLTDSITISDIKSLITDYSSVFYNIAGTDISDDIIDGDYDSVAIGNGIFNSNDSTVAFSEGDYIVFVYNGKFYLDTATNFEAWLNVGDVCIITELNVPDRWYDSHYYHVLETTKVDLTNYYTKSEANTLLNAKADSSSIATAYDNTLTYAVGDLCMHNGQLYECNTAISTPEDFDSSKWTAVNVMGKMPVVENTTFNASNSYLDAIKIGGTNYNVSPISFGTNANVRGKILNVYANIGGANGKKFIFSVETGGAGVNAGWGIIYEKYATGYELYFVSEYNGNYNKVKSICLLPEKDTDGNDINTTDTYNLKIVGGNVVAVKDV